MAGIEALTPPISSDPQARLWAQVRALQQRVASLEARRDVIVRASGGGGGDGGEVTYFSFSFVTSGRPLLIHWGPSFDFCPASDGVFARTRPIYLDIPAAGKRVTTLAANLSTVATIAPAPAVSVVYRDIPAGRYTATISGTERMRSSYLILELP